MRKAALIDLVEARARLGLSMQGAPDHAWSEFCLRTKIKYGGYPVDWKEKVLDFYDANPLPNVESLRSVLSATQRESELWLRMEERRARAAGL